MKVLNLFGEMQELKEPKNRSKYDIFKLRNKYRKGDGMKSCKNCSHLIKKSYSKVYYKCEKMGNTNCESSDIRVKMLCNLWEENKCI